MKARILKCGNLRIFTCYIIARDRDMHALITYASLDTVTVTNRYTPKEGILKAGAIDGPFVGHNLWPLECSSILVCSRQKFCTRSAQLTQLKVRDSKSDVEIPLRNNMNKLLGK